MTDNGERPRWVEVSVAIPREREEAATALLGDGALGATVERLTESTSMVRVFHAIDGEPAELHAATERLLRLSGMAAEASGLRVAAVPDGRWVESYQESLRPFALGRGFLVCPASLPAEPGDRRPLRLVPGRAFGTGEHPTTRQCVERLESLVRPGDRWLDLGCGTGVLSLVIRFCGASSVLGLDVDPEAVAVAREVLAANGAPDGVRFEQGTLDSRSVRAMDGIVCNVSATLLVERAADLAACIRPGGLLLASGFLVADDEEEVRRALEAGELRALDHGSDDGWAVSVLQRTGDRR